MAAIGFLYASCSTNTSQEETTEAHTPEVVVYTLNAESSSLNWKGMMSPEYFHVGTVTLSEGSLTTEDGTIKEGSFTVDMTSIRNTDLEEPKSGYLEGHLKGTIVDENNPVNSFFNTPEFPTVTVTVGNYEEGNLETTLNILGKELTQSVPVSFKPSEEGAIIEGAFSMDFTSLQIPGLQPNPETGESISPNIEFELKLVLRK